MLAWPAIPDGMPIMAGPDIAEGIEPGDGLTESSGCNVSTGAPPGELGVAAIIAPGEAG